MLGNLNKIVDVLAYLVVVVLTNLCDTNLLMERWLGALEFVKHFLVELLARTQTRKLNLDILGTGELDHALGKVGNLHGFAHVENEDFTTIALRASFEHQLTSLGNEHEEANDTFVSNSYRAAVLNLFAEQGNDTSVGSQHITETCGNELCASRRSTHLTSCDEAESVAQDR